MDKQQKRRRINKNAEQYLYIWIYLRDFSLSSSFVQIHIAKNDQKSPRTGIYNSVSKLPAHFYVVVVVFLLLFTFVVFIWFFTFIQSARVWVLLALFFPFSIFLLFLAFFGLLPLPCSLYLNSIDAGFVTLHTYAYTQHQWFHVHSFMLICIHINSNHCLYSRCLFHLFVSHSLFTSAPRSRALFLSLGLCAYTISISYHKKMKKKKTDEIKWFPKIC